MQKNDEIVLNITDVTHDGNGVGKYDGVAIFVPGTAVGDTVRVHIVKVLKNYCFGKAVEIIEKSKDRIRIDCPVFSRCGGCVYRHIDYKAESLIKANRVENVMRRIGNVTVSPSPILTGNPDHYRNKAQYPVSLSGEVGFYAVHSHRIIPCGECALQPEEFSSIAEVFSKYIKECALSAYNEETGKGLIRHLYLRKATATNEIMVAIVINGNALPKVDLFVDSLRILLGESLKTVVININKEKTNVILGKENTVVYGDGYITDILCGNKIRINPLSFYQVNRTMAEVLYKKAEEYADVGGKSLLDLYCGAGTIGLSFAKSAKSVIGVEIIKEAVEDAKFNAQINNISNARFICADAAKAAKQLESEGIHPDVVILDPPRKGCDNQLLGIVANSFSPDRIVYVSCDPATLARDCKTLAELGYKVKEYTPVDLFPRTSHVETVALLSRQKVDEHIYFDVNVQDLPKTARTTATYPEIKAYVKDKYGLNVTSLNIAQVKEKHGFEKRENYNKGKDGHRVPNCPPEKEKAIEDAFKHFGML
ncbi:MAG: 23S rRNA (uracil(1939)-C(5))-methyltransferase RlmD [Clostridia bacterium]|nr:23S rRNA (uracil(1939)-C(5))-methyltransferase RlmD [Clostridia bacterium]